MSDAKTAHCWTGAPIYCLDCKGPTESLEDEYGGLSDGGSYERFRCINPACENHGVTVYIELPD